MGIFSGGVEIYVNTSVSRVIKDELLPDSIKAGVIGSIFHNGDTSEYVMEGLVSGLGMRVERMYEYASKNYTHGLPSGRFLFSNEGVEEVTTVLTAIEGGAIAVNYSHLCSPNFIHIGWMKLIAEHGYNTATNAIQHPTLAGVTAYVRNMQVVIPESLFNTVPAESQECWGTPPNGGYVPTIVYPSGMVAEMAPILPIKVDPLATDISLKVDYVWVSSVGSGNETLTILNTDAFTMAVTGYDITAEYFHVKYTNGGVTKYWMYRHDTGVYPTLDALFDVPASVQGTYFPFTYFRYKKADTTTDKTTQDYLTTKHMLKSLGLDYDSVAEGINSSPTITDVEQAMMIFAVPAVSTDPLEQRYLYTFFNNMHYSNDTPPATPTMRSISARLREGGPVKHAAVLQDKRFKMALTTGGIYKSRKAGVIGKVGSYSSELVTTMESRTIEVADGVFGAISVPVKVYHYRHQVSSALYDELIVEDLRMTYHIWNQYTAIGKAGEAILLIPLDHAITGQYTIAEREILYARAMHFVFNSMVAVDVEWYETDLFQVIVLFVSLVLLVISWGESWEATAAALEAGLTTWTEVIITYVLNYVVATALFKIFIKIVGAKAAFLIAMVGMAVGVAQMDGTGSLMGAPWAKELLQLSTGLMKGVQDAYSEDMKDLLKEESLYGLEVKEKLEKLTEAQKLLEHSNKLDPFVIFGESPTDYYQRTVHSGNIGVLGLDAISSYVDNALTLPKLTDTLQEKRTWPT